jgi:protein-S-isoprenylcysteine O-methyltransferase Ste14
MPKYFGVLTIVLLLGMVLTRISVLRKQGIKAMKFGHIDKTDFLIPPFALFYFYVLFAAAFHWPTVTAHQFFHSEIISWTGVLFCLAGLLLFLWSLISFRQSFRVGIDADHPDRLITDGVFASRSKICLNMRRPPCSDLHRVCCRLSGSAGGVRHTQVHDG